MEKIKSIRNLFAPLAQYDDLAAKEVEDLRRTSDTVAKEIETMNAELSRLTVHVDADSRKEGLSALYAEEALNEKKIAELRNELPHLSEECAALRLVLEPSRFEEEFKRISEQLEELREKQEGLGRELLIMEKEAAAYDPLIEESQTQLGETISAIAEMETQAKQLISKNESLGRLDKLTSLVSRDEEIERSGEARAGAVESKFSAEVAALREGLKRKDRQSLDSARDVAGPLAQEYGDMGKEINDLLLLLISKFSLMQELEEKERVTVSLNTESEEIQCKIAGKTAALNEIRALNGDDKKRFASLEHEIIHYRKTVATLADEIAQVDEIISKREGAVAEFVSLFVQECELEEKALAVHRKMNELNNIAGEMV